ncbi:uncharacterized protein EKO05_0011486 [Ascochyta rabiei]|uniref:uncharacterized protein n=1 Tax=Didymella rabiei TaxID=5454 RepID=UPI00220A3FB2|nr:uncharacterized protein EKO05_0011486 [Ascochyta rabiei]UPX21296.1 hypothetical protein EKO05_0011486 [Ascochyta rabiei]
MTSSMAPSQISSLLTMPGGTRPTHRLADTPLTRTQEIRNRIYDLAIADVLHKATQPGLAHPRRKAHTIREAQLLTRNWRLFRRLFLGLTQACRQLREEFLPTHQYRIPMTVQLTELEAYFATFVHDTNMANVKLQLHDGVRPTEMRALILRCATSPRILIDYACSPRCPMAEILAYPESYVAFYDYLVERTERIVAVPGSCTVARPDGSTFKRTWIVGLDVYVKQEFAEAWMDAPLVGTNTAELGYWRDGLGLPVGAEVVPMVD